MNKFTLSALATCAALNLNASDIQYPWMEQINNFSTGLLKLYEPNTCAYIVAGGSANYSTSSYPQYALYDLFDAATLDSPDFGSTTGDSFNSESFQDYFWGVYGGFHQPATKNWIIGIEVGYKRLVSTRSTVDIIYTTVPITAPLVKPFRNVDNNVWDLMAVVKYQTAAGLNVFLKAGGAKVHTVIKEGHFINPTDITLSSHNVFGTRSYSLTNIYPEVEVGAGYRFLNHFEIHLSYAKIFAQDENDYVSPSTGIFFRPRKCPSIDVFSVSLEMLLF